MEPRLIELQSIIANCGSLSIASVESGIPFTPKRIFFVYNVEDSDIIRGSHAHKKCEQLLVASNGALKVDYENKLNKGSVILDSPRIGLYLPSMTWSIQYNYTFGSTLTVLASEEYDESDYIRNYQEFVNYE
jgi:hypothetical protein